MSVYGRTHAHGLPDAKRVDEQQEADDWDTDPDYVNSVSEKEQRWGSKLIVPEKGEVAEQGIKAIQQKAMDQHNTVATQEYNQKKTLYGGK